MEERLPKKRKKGSRAQTGGPEPKKQHVSSGREFDDSVEAGSRIDDLETQILESPKNYNQINELLEYAKDNTSKRIQEKAELSLCAVFSHFLAENRIPLDGPLPTQENIVGRWLLKRYERYCQILLQAQSWNSSGLELQLLMQLVKQEVSVATSNSIWMEGLYSKVIIALLGQDSDAVSFDAFAADHILPHRDTRMYACRIFGGFENQSNKAIDLIISVLSSVELPSQDSEEETTYLVKLPRQSKRKHPSEAVYKKTMEEAWLMVIRNSLTTAQRKRLLDLVPDHIAPWFSKPEMLTDFLTDSFNAGGSESLTALSGMFYLIQHRNLDYPQFYAKVYSMIDQQILHAKQRSRFLRLMMIFLASTHLPAALVASFMKRLSRLCLFAPPAAIIAIVPWLYNMIKEHPFCAYMIHRKHRYWSSASDKTDLLGEDPFLFMVLDPMHTDALASSLWEIETLATHYHPNVATIASIISKPFTKQAYKVEDFLDYTYDGMLDAELARSLKKPPVVEFQIPKRIFSQAKDGDASEEEKGRKTLLRSMWDCGC